MSPSTMPPVLDDLSHKIRPGQYVAIVGKTGCGKSTLMRIMPGFETPQKAAELSGMADDIRAMPMGMNTLISEGHGGISGGQRQRLDDEEFVGRTTAF